MSAEKKKLLILGVLALVVLCVGVFQFTGGSKKEPAAAPKAADHKSTQAAPADETKPSFSTPAQATALNQTAAPGPNQTGNPTAPGANANGNPLDKNALALAAAQPNLAERDPFDGARYAPVKQPAAAPAVKTPKQAPAPALGKIPPLTLTGELPGGKGQPINLPPAQVKDTFDYSVSGVITGDKPAAIFSDGKGNQRLIRLGDSLDGDTRVVSISRGKVTVSHHGKDMTLKVGADNPTEKRSDEK